jgi:hypothetical protein
MPSLEERACPHIIAHSRGAARRPDAPVALAADQCRSLLDELATLTTPSKRRGRRHALGATLAVAVAAVLAGARSLVAIGEWAADAPGPVLAALGVRRDPLRRVYRPPGEVTVRRVLARVDPEGLDQVIGGGWPTSNHPTPGVAAGGRGRRQVRMRSPGRSQRGFQGCVRVASKGTGCSRTGWQVGGWW